MVFATFLSVTFQSARLYSISPPLTAYITLGDALLKIGIAMPAIGFTMFLLVDLVEDFADRMRSGEPYIGSKGHQVAKVFSYFLLAIAVAAGGIALYKIPLSEMAPGNLAPYLKVIGTVALFIFFLRVCVKVLWRISVVRHNAEASGTITDQEVMTLFVYGLSGALAFGGLSAIYGNPEYCEIKTTDAVQNGYFLAALQSVTALDIDGQTIILSNSQIKQINCDIPLPSKEDSSDR